MPSIKISIPGEPKAKARPKFTTVGGFARAYTDKKTLNYESLVTLSAINSGLIPDIPLETPVVVQIDVLHGRTKELSRRLKNGQYKHATDRIPKTTKPDADNCAKSILDGLNAAGIWRDDSYVWSLQIRKMYAAIDEAPHCDVLIQWDD